MRESRAVEQAEGSRGRGGVTGVIRRVTRPRGDSSDGAVEHVERVPLGWGCKLPAPLCKDTHAGSIQIACNRMASLAEVFLISLSFHSVTYYCEPKIKRQDYDTLLPVFEIFMVCL